MNILIDAHMVGERETGNETYIVNLIRGLQAVADRHELILATAHPSDLADRIALDDRCRPAPVSASPVKRLLVDLPALARRERVDLLHSTYTAPLQPGCPFVVSIHDVAYRSHPEWYSLRDRMVLGFGIRSSIHRAARVVTISEHSKREILHHFRLSPDRISVTPLAAAPIFLRAPDEERAREALRRHAICPPYVLAAGNLQPRKNLARLIEAFGRVRERKSLPHTLVLCGKAQWRESEIHAAIRRLRMESTVRFTGYVSDDDLAALFYGADVFAYPSLYEGFGLPVIEAMACGTPVITSKTASMPEVAGNAALLVDPYNIDELAAALMSVLTSPERRQRLRTKGLERARAFSWEQTARATLAVYETAASRYSSP